MPKNQSVQMDSIWHRHILNHPSLEEDFSSIFGVFTAKGKKLMKAYVFLEANTFHLLREA